jgi:hypothetical protein
MVGKYVKAFWGSSFQIIILIVGTIFDKVTVNNLLFQAERKPLLNLNLYFNGVA